jgi:hypothetical protein
MGASPALAVRLERTLHDVRSPATVERGRRNVNNIEPRQRVSIKRGALQNGSFDARETGALSRLKSCATVASPAGP